MQQQVKEFSKTGTSFPKILLIFVDFYGKSNFILDRVINSFHKLMRNAL